MFRGRCFCITLIRFCLISALLCAVKPGAQSAEVPEYQVKAAFLYNFTKYVEWPNGALPSDSSPFVIGVLGDDPFGSNLDKAVDGKSLDDHKIVVKSFKRIDDLQRCQMLFVCRSEKNNIKRVIDRLGKANTLVIGDNDNFLQQGGTVNFIIVERKVRFEINSAAAERANLKVSSKLLQLATKVVRN